MQVAFNLIHVVKVAKSNSIAKQINRMNRNPLDWADRTVPVRALYEHVPHPMHVSLRTRPRTLWAAKESIFRGVWARLHTHAEDVRPLPEQREWVSPLSLLLSLSSQTQQQKIVRTHKSRNGVNVLILASCPRLVHHEPRGPLQWQHPARVVASCQ